MHYCIIAHSLNQLIIMGKRVAILLQSSKLISRTVRRVLVSFLDKSRSSIKRVAGRVRSSGRENCSGFNQLEDIFHFISFSQRKRPRAAGKRNIRNTSIAKSCDSAIVYLYLRIRLDFAVGFKTG